MNAAGSVRPDLGPDFTTLAVDHTYESLLLGQEVGALNVRPDVVSLARRLGAAVSVGLIGSFRLPPAHDIASALEHNLRNPSLMVLHATAELLDRAAARNAAMTRAVVKIAAGWVSPLERQAEAFVEREYGFVNHEGSALAPWMWHAVLKRAAAMPGIPNELLVRGGFKFIKSYRRSIQSSVMLVEDQPDALRQLYRILVPVDGEYQRYANMLGAYREKRRRPDARFGRVASWTEQLLVARARQVAAARPRG